MIDVYLQGRLPSILTAEEVVEAFRAAAKAIKKPSRGSVSIVFVTPTEMQRLNRTWRKKDKRTDVLSFTSSEDFPAPREEEKAIGELFLDAGFIREEAKRRKITFHEELIRNIVHGALHLYGYDHATLEEEKVMFGIQERVVHSCGKQSC